MPATLGSQSQVESMTEVRITFELCFFNQQMKILIVLWRNPDNTSI